MRKFNARIVYNGDEIEWCAVGTFNDLTHLKKSITCTFGLGDLKHLALLGPEIVEPKNRSNDDAKFEYSQDGSTMTLVIANDKWTSPPIDVNNVMLELIEIDMSKQIDSTKNLEFFTIIDKSPNMKDHYRSWLISE